MQFAGAITSPDERSGAKAYESMPRQNTAAADIADYFLREVSP